MIPSWAKGQALKSALYNQFLLDFNPDTVFAECAPPDLAKIFSKAPPKNKLKFSRRTSSAIWAPSPSRPGMLHKKH